MNDPSAAVRRYERLIRLQPIVITIFAAAVLLLLGTIVIGTLRARVNVTVPLAMAMFVAIAIWKGLEYRAFIAMREAQGQSRDEARAEWRTANPGPE